jgi:nicotinamidase-related amidase
MSELDARRCHLIVVDPQAAFADPAGSLARTYGGDDVRPVAEVLERLADFLAAAPDELAVTVVRSEYPPGLAVDDARLAELCTAGSADVAWAAAFRPAPAWPVVTKAGFDAWSSPDFRERVDAVAADRPTLVLTGCLLTTCVAAVARSCRRERPELGVLVLTDLVAARASAAASDRVGRTLDELRDLGCELAPSGSLRWRQVGFGTERGGRMAVDDDAPIEDEPAADDVDDDPEDDEIETVLDETLAW